MNVLVREKSSKDELKFRCQWLYNLDSYSEETRKFKLLKNSCFVNEQSRLPFRSRMNYDNLDKELKNIIDKYSKNNQTNYNYRIVKKPLYNEFVITGWN